MASSTSWPRQQSRLLRLDGSRRNAFHLIAATPSAPGVRRQLRQSFQLFCAPAASPTQQITHPRGNQLRVGINQLQTRYSDWRTRSSRLLAPPRRPAPAMLLGRHRRRLHQRQQQRRDSVVNFRACAFPVPVRLIRHSLNENGVDPTLAEQRQTLRCSRRRRAVIGAGVAPTGPCRPVKRQRRSPGPGRWFCRWRYIHFLRGIPMLRGLDASRRDVAADALC